jgi:hypothetical protein
MIGTRVRDHARLYMYVCVVWYSFWTAIQVMLTILPNLNHISYEYFISFNVNYKKQEHRPQQLHMKNFWEVAFVQVAAN